jgi:hypothetical protein
MKIVISCILVALLSVQFADAQRTKKHKQHKYIPPMFHNVYLGMGLEDFKKARPKIKEAKSEYDFRIVYVEKAPTSYIKQVVYYFGSKGEKPFYEFIIEYTTEAKRDQVAKQYLKRKNVDGKEWKYDSKEGFLMKAWTFKAKLVIIGVIEGTEWWEDE